MALVKYPFRALLACLLKVNSNAPIEIRLATASDLPVLRAIYADSIDTLGPAAYRPEQVAAWKAFASQPGFGDFILGVNTYVAMLGSEIVGFCGIADDGHVTSAYLRPEHCGQGIGASLLNQVLARHPRPSSGSYYAEASLFSLPLFRRCGFHQSGREQVLREGVVFERFLVKRAVNFDLEGNLAS